MKSFRGAPVSGATIFVNGVNTTMTDEKGIYYLSFDQFPSKNSISIEKAFFIFDPFDVTITEETREIAEVFPTATYVCGRVFTINRETNEYELSKKPRTVSCLQEPNPLEQETWETPGIEDRLVPWRNTTVKSDGEFCFTAKKGLWRVITYPYDDEKGVHF